MKARKTVTEVEQFLLESRRVDENDCWLWMGACDPNGYGKIKVRRFCSGNMQVHRLAAFLWMGWSLGGNPVFHLCQSNACFNPSHLTQDKPGYRHKYTLNESAFDVLSPEALYWLGFLYADAHLHEGGVKLCLCVKDQLHVRKLASFLGSNAPSREYGLSGGLVKSVHQAAQCSFYSKKLARRLSDLGMTHPSLDRDVVADSIRCSRDFWRGIVDGDGSLGIYTYKRKIEHTFRAMGGPTLMERFCQYIDEALGFRPFVQKREKVWQLALCKARARTLVRLLYEGASVSLDRKQAIADRMMAYNAKEVMSANGKRGYEKWAGIYSTEQRQQWSIKGNIAANKKRWGDLKNGNDSA